MLFSCAVPFSFPPFCVWTVGSGDGLTVVVRPGVIPTLALSRLLLPLLSTLICGLILLHFLATLHLHRRISALCVCSPAFVTARGARCRPSMPRAGPRALADSLRPHAGMRRRVDVHVTTVMLASKRLSSLSRGNAKKKRRTEAKTRNTVLALPTRLGVLKPERSRRRRTERQSNVCMSQCVERATGCTAVFLRAHSAVCLGSVREVSM